MGSRVRPLVLTALLVGTSAARAAPCDAPVVIGDPALVASVTEILSAHIPTDSCAAVRVRLDGRESSIVVVHLDATDTVIEERVVSEPATAATVIESWSRSDLVTPLLSVHPLDLPERHVPPPRVAFFLPTVVERRVESPSSTRGVALTAAMETSFANDRTSWVGGVVGICIRVGRICVATRARFATLVDGPGIWKFTDRRGIDAVFGGDIPFGVGPTTLVAGFGVGMGAVRTIRRTDGMDAGSVTFGIRAETHVAWVIPLGRRIALDLSATLNLAQVTDVESSTTGSLADEPRALGRLGAGLRFGGR